MTSLQSTTRPQQAASREQTPSAQSVQHGGGAVSLKPCLASEYNRYAREKSGASQDGPFAQPEKALSNPTSPKHSLQNATVIPPFTRPTSLIGQHPVPGWEACVHPEGDTYFYHVDLRVVTPVNPADQAAQQLLEFAGAALLKAVRATGDEHTVEIWLNLESNVVKYYMVDHPNRVIFWGQGVRPADLGLETAEGEGFLKSSLTGEYWGHIESYPCHQRYWVPAETELIGILAHGAVDDFTSPGSTCPWSSQNCTDFINILEKFKGLDGVDALAYRVVCIARLWAMLARVRHINRYGLTRPRLDRLQGLIEYFDTQNKASWKILIGEALVLGLSHSKFARLTALWNDRVVYHRHWARFFKDIQRQWMKMGGLSLVIWMINAFLIGQGHRFAGTMISASLSGASVLISVILNQSHSADRLATAPDITAFIVRVEDFYQGLRPLSIAFTLPHALTVYSALVLQGSLVWIAVGNVGDIMDFLSVASLWLFPTVLALFLFTVFGARTIA